MDPSHFDRLARWWARPLRRRRLLAGAAALLAGASTLPRGVQAHHGCNEACSQWNPHECCGDSCCYSDPGSIEDRDQYCASADRGICCRKGDVGNYRSVLCIRKADDSGTCVEDPECKGEKDLYPDKNWYLGSLHCSCFGCEKGQIPCRETETCCNADQTCGTDGQCVDACPTGQEARGVRATAAAACCKDGEISCGETCVLPCPPDMYLNYNTCACQCVTKCGDICCPFGLICSYDGGAGGNAKCCPPGEACGAVCTEGKFKCCGTGRYAFTCSRIHTCCPAGRRGESQCCLQGKETCDDGRCVKKKKPKKKKRKGQKGQSAAGANDQARGNQTVGSFRRTPLTFRKQRRPRSAGSD